MKPGNSSSSGLVGSKSSPIGKQHVVRFTSRGATSTTPNPLTGNAFYNLNQVGNPFDGSQDGAFAKINVSIDVRNFFGNVLKDYDQYRVISCLTTVAVKDAPKQGPLMGEILFTVDKDSRDTESLTLTCNRSTLSQRIITNEKHVHNIEWHPFLIEDTETFDVSGKQVDYVQPRNRWLNTNQVSYHRHGALRMVVTVPNGGAYSSDQSVQVRHRVVIECRGLRSVQ